MRSSARAMDRLGSAAWRSPLPCRWAANSERAHGKARAAGRNTQGRILDGPGSGLRAARHQAALEKVKGYIELGIKEGAKLAVDGRGFKLQGYENGNFLGGSLFDHVKPEMRIYKEEIFGPVLSVVRAKSYDEGLSLPTSMNMEMASRSIREMEMRRGISPRKCRSA